MVVATLVSVFVAVTLALGTLAPDGSLAVPVMEAVIVCAGARLANRHSVATIKPIFVRIRLLLFRSFKIPHFGADSRNCNLPSSTIQVLEVAGTPRWSPREESLTRPVISALMDAQ